MSGKIKQTKPKPQPENVDGTDTCPCTQDETHGQNPIWPGEGAQKPGKTLKGPKPGEKTIIPKVQ